MLHALTLTLSPAACSTSRFGMPPPQLTALRLRSCNCLPPQPAHKVAALPPQSRTAFVAALTRTISGAGAGAGRLARLHAHSHPADGCVLACSACMPQGASQVRHH